MPEFISKLDYDEARLFPLTRYAIELMLLTFVRISELQEATKEEIDFENKTWIIPAERMKMRKAHIVSLSNQSIRILKVLSKLNEESNYVFPSQNSHRKPMSNNTILYALYRMSYKGKTT